MQMIGQLLVAAAVLATVSFVISGQLGFLSGIQMHPSNESVTNPPGRFDYYKLSLQWPPSACSDPGNSFVHIPNEQFTIHDLWPQRDGDVSVSPYYIDDTCVDARTVPVPPYELNGKLPNDLKRRLEVHWPDLFSNDDFMFWYREWRDHGECSDYAQDPKSYFEIALTLHSGFIDLPTDLLIPLGTPFTAGDILEKAKSEYGFILKLYVTEMVVNRSCWRSVSVMKGTRHHGPFRIVPADYRVVSIIRKLFSLLLQQQRKEIIRNDTNTVNYDFSHVANDTKVI